MNASIKQLRERACELATEARTVLDTIDANTSDGDRKDIEARFDAMMADCDKLHDQADREERLAAAESRGAPSGLPGDPPTAAATGDAPEGRTPAYGKVFEKALRFGAATLSAEERHILMAHRTDLPEELRAQSVGTDSAGGYTVPEEFSGEIERSMVAWGPMWDASICRELNTGTGARINWPTIDDTSKTGRIKAENGSVDDDGTDDATFGEKQLDAYVYDTGMVKVPIELLQDSAFNMESMLSDLFAERLGRLANSVLTTGTGSSQPNGVVTAAAAGITAAAVAAITGDELINLLHEVDPAYRSSPNCRWMFNDSTLSAIRKLKDGQGNYLWQLGDIRNGEPATLLGHPYSINQAMASMGASNVPVLFGDFSKYIVRKVSGFQVITLRERYAESFQVGMVGFKRFDGELLNSAAVKKLANAAV